VGEYLAPGVYVEETSFRAPSIEGVGTSTAAFVGPALTGPISPSPEAGIDPMPPELITSFSDFAAVYGGYGDLTLGGKIVPNYLALSVKAFFDNGGSRLYVSRVFTPGTKVDPADATKTIADAGVATNGTPGDNAVAITARFPGSALNSTGTGPNSPSLGVTLVSAQTQSVASLPQGSVLYDPDGKVYYTNGGGSGFVQVADATKKLDPAALPAKLTLVTLSVSAPSASGSTSVYEGLGLDASHPRYLGTVLGQNPPRHIDALENQVAFIIGKNLNAATLAAQLVPDGVGAAVKGGGPRKASAQVDIVASVDGAAAAVGKAHKIGTDGKVADADISSLKAGDRLRVMAGESFPIDGVITSGSASAQFALSGGSDGAEPTNADYDTALEALDALEDIAIVAAPGSSAFTAVPAGSKSSTASQVVNTLIEHVERTRAYRVAILDTPANAIASDVRDVRSRIDSSYAALYTPWIVTPNPLARPGTAISNEITVPPSGFMAGIYARNDVLHSVAKAPANEVVLGALRFERNINFAEQGSLNPLGINCLRFFPGRGYRVWGARTASSNAEIKYVNVRRYLVYLEHSIDNGTQWAVFENNGPLLWARVRESVEEFLHNELKEGNLLGTSDAEAYFVRCDRSTMTQNDLDNGRLICLIGVALLKPAEFVIFRIGQKTADARS
jgi:Bacteriophage tail sheath protein